MHPRPVLAFCAVLAVMVSATAGHAHSYSFKGLEIGHLWSPTPSVGANGVAVYGPLFNTGSGPIEVIGVSSPDARQARFRIDDNGNVSWPAKLVLQPDKPLGLAPWRVHIWLSGLTKKLLSGDEVPLVLVLSDGRHLHVASMVGSAAGG